LAPLSEEVSEKHGENRTHPSSNGIDEGCAVDFRRKCFLPVDVVVAVATDSSTAQYSGKQASKHTQPPPLVSTVRYSTVRLW
jgi:hypothetical protein